MSNARVAEAQRKLDAVKESIEYYEMTINKFREHVSRQQVHLFIYLFIYFELSYNVQEESANKVIFKNMTTRNAKSSYAHRRLLVVTIRLELCTSCSSSCHYHFHYL